MSRPGLRTGHREGAGLSGQQAIEDQQSGWLE